MGEKVLTAIVGIILVGGLMTVSGVFVICVIRDTINDIKRKRTRNNK